MVKWCLFINKWNNISILSSSVQSLSPVQLFAIPWTTAHQALLSITNSQSSPKPMSIELVTPSNHLILCRPLLLLPSVFPSIRVFSSELALHVRWSKYWSFSFSPFSEYSELISSIVLVLVARPTTGCVRYFYFHTGSPSHLSMHPFPVSLMC